MRRCLQLAANGLGFTYPNPLVGCVIVHQGKIIGEGWHRKAGEAHAEVNAIDSVEDKTLLKDSELYVNLEPCSHHGRTPPCADLIVRMGIPRVFIGSLDDNAEVNGAGVSKLEKNGCEVKTGILEKECRELNRRFFTFHTRNRPYIILKWAESADGFLFPSENRSTEKGPIWISNEYSRQMVHKWRAEEGAILVGTRTVQKDDPSLTVRDVKGNSILRLVIDRQGKTDWSSKVFQAGSQTIVIADKNHHQGSVPEKFRKNVRMEKMDFTASLPVQILELLVEEEVQSLIIEGGAVTLNSFIEAGLWDEARVFKGENRFDAGIGAPNLPGVPVSEKLIGGDRLLVYRKDEK
jgi:diaminohydroxyphosphoribosylaminopyrimidine deaminase/5-amino-6-(5-phosphoribosylamino)uracil reductase